MESKRRPADLNALSRVGSHEVIWVKSGNGTFEVDFQCYLFTQEIVLFLEPGQYFRVLAGELVVENFPLEKTGAPIADFRHLFKHLVSVGHILPLPNETAAAGVSNSESFLQRSLRSWQRMNPFGASPDEINVLFSLHEELVQKISAEPSGRVLAMYAGGLSASVKETLRRRLKLSFKELVQRRKLLLAQRELVFTAKPIKEIAYGLGFDDPAYFSRFFSQQKDSTPQSFRDSLNACRPDTFIEDFLELTDTHYREQRSIHFYASKMGMSPRNLSRKVSAGFNCTVQTVLRRKLLGEASRLLAAKWYVKEVAAHLGFKHPQHFSAFYKLYSRREQTIDRG